LLHSCGPRNIPSRTAQQRLFTMLDMVRIVRGNRNNKPREKVTLDNFPATGEYRQKIDVDSILSQFVQLFFSF
jgi:hypothetical protein